jgi:hypothetical protein
MHEQESAMIHPGFSQHPLHPAPSSGLPRGVMPDEATINQVLKGEMRFLQVLIHLLPSCWKACRCILIWPTLIPSLPPSLWSSTWPCGKSRGRLLQPNPLVWDSITWWPGPTTITLQQLMLPLAASHDRKAFPQIHGR